MSLNHSTSVTTKNLLLNLDFKNPKKFSTDLGNNNLVQDWKYNAATWINQFPANSTVSSGIDAPDGTKTAVRLSCKTTGSSLLRVGFNSFTPNGTDTYIISFWVRKVSGTTSTGSQLFCDLADATPSLDYASQLVTGKWVRIVTSAIPTATAKTWFDLLSNNTNDYVLDFWGVKIEIQNDTGTYHTFKDTVGGNVFSLYRPLLSTVDTDYVKFDRVASPKNGGLMNSTLTGNLTAANFLYNNHTWEIWFKINDITPVGSTNEGVSCLAGYNGYHAGFWYSASSLTYSLWNGTAGNPTCASWTVGTSGAQINQGSWYQVVVVANNGSFIPYVNGQQVGTSYTPTYSVTGIGISNTLNIGAFQNLAAGTGNYCYYSKNQVANMKMYNRALSPSEILQNFNALKGRFGL